MPGISNQQTEGIQVPVTTGEFPTNEPSTVPERVMSDITPPEASLTAPAATAPIEDAAKAEAFSAIDQAATAGASDAPANSGLDNREENAGEPVQINTDARTAVTDSLGGNHQGLEAQIGGSVEEVAPEEPVAEPVPAPVMASAEPATEPAATPTSIAPVVELPQPTATPEPTEPEPEPVQPEALPAIGQLQSVPPDQAPVVEGEPRTISKNAEVKGVELALKNIEIYRESRDRALDRAQALSRQAVLEKDTAKQAELEMQIRQAVKEADSWCTELNITTTNLAFYLQNRTGDILPEQGPSSGGNK